MDIDKTLSDMKINVSNIITYEDACSISNFIIEENKINDHMVEKSPISILDSADKYGCIKISQNDNII
ncbi:MAG: hypothetical protein U9Q66_03375 [Patescibacteria group bacterium]|nr:hypothetical protein [Patescibacteria group bacterium]